MLRGQQNSINHLDGIRSKALGPLPVIIAVLLIYLPVIAMLGRHMLRLGNVLGESSIRPSVSANQLIISVTNPDFSHRCFQESRLAIQGVGYGIVMLIVVQVVVAGNLSKISILTGTEAAVGQRPHLRLVKGCKSFLPGVRLSGFLPGIEFIHNAPDFPVQIFHTVKDPFFHFLQQVGFQPLDSFFNSRLSLGLSGRRREHHHIVKPFQVLVCRVMYYDQCAKCAFYMGSLFYLKLQGTLHIDCTKCTDTRKE